MFRQSSAVVRDNFIYNNEGGLKVSSAPSEVRNNTIVKNSAKGIWATATTNSKISNCVVWGNDSNDLVNCVATYSCIEDVNDAAGEGNITSVPCFVDADANDFHLGPDSPCMDAGDPDGDYSGQVDIDGDVRVMCTADMGADEVECFPSDYSAYADWVTMGQPDCWCYCWEYQCYGDADGAVTADANEYRVSQDDVDVLSANWMKLIDDPALNPCADVDHKAYWKGYRVYTGDLNILQANWQKKDEDLDPNCPHP